MRNFICGLLVILYCGYMPVGFGMNLMDSVYAQDQASEDAQIFFEEALTLKRKGDVDAASKMFLKSIRTSRSVLAHDDHGLIADLKIHCEKELEKDDKNLKILDTLGFLYAVCYSDSTNAIKYYQKVYDLSDSDKVKEKTQRLIDRIEATAEAEAKVQDDMAEQIRNEKLKSWSELEKSARLGEQKVKSQELSTNLASSYRQKDSLKNRVPQLEKELTDLKADYEKQNRRWHSTNDELYNRRRRRLKDQVANKEVELSKAKSELDDVVDRVAILEKEDQNRIDSRKSSPIRSYDEDEGGEEETSQQPSENQGAGSSASQPPANDYGSPSTSNQQPPANDYGSPDAQSSEVISDTEVSGAQSSEDSQPLPALNVEDNTATAIDTDEINKEDKLNELINNL